MRRTLFTLLSCLVLASCGGEQFSDLRQFVKDSDKLPHGHIPPLPQVKPYEPFVYNAFDITDPFRPRKIEQPKTAKGSGLQPDFNRRREPLEAFPLENLKMVGTLQRKKEIYAIIITPQKNLFRVTVGNHVGQDFGRIISISESTIKLKELVQDGSGNWEERDQSLLLQE